MLLTIFTPAYNRADKLKNLYRSLKKQPNKEYEWLIVDDGSTDNTEEVVDAFLQESFVNIKYIKKRNGGKHTAHNRAVDLASGSYFMCLDSDDILNENAIRDLLIAVKKCNENEGIIAYKKDKKNILLSDIFPNVECISNTYLLEKEYKCRGEFTLLYPTKVLKKNKFPVFENERFLTESVLYDRLKCPMRLLPKVIEICEYQLDGLSQNLNKIMRENPAGYCLYFMQRIDMQVELRDRVIEASKYIAFCILAGEKKSLYKGKNESLIRWCYPLGFLFWIYYKVIRKL